MRTLTTRRVRKARRLMQREPYGPCSTDKPLVRHRWAFDGYFWHRCVNCGRVS